MIIEFFGLSKSGKSTLKRRLNQKGYFVSKTSVLKTQDPNYIVKSISFIKHFIINPLDTIYLFYKLNTNKVPMDISLYNRLRIFKMRNFYLVSVLGKYEQIKNKKNKIFADEFSFQSLFMIIQAKSNKKEFINILKKLPKSDYLFLFERDKNKRDIAYRIPHIYKPGATLLPGSWINKDYALALTDSMEYNFKIIKKIIIEYYKRDKDNFKDIIKLIKNTNLKKIGEDKHSFRDLKLKPPRVYIKR